MTAIPARAAFPGRAALLVLTALPSLVLAPGARAPALGVQATPTRPHASNFLTAQPTPAQPTPAAKPVQGEAAASDGSEGRELSLVSGPVTVRVRLDPAAAVIGDTLTLTIEVRAEKGVEVLMPEFGEALDEFAIVDFAPRRRLDARGGQVETQVYRLQPARSGPQAIPPIVVEYVDRRPGQAAAPEDLDAYEILTERLPFTISSVAPSAAGAALQPPLGELPPRKPPQAARWPWSAALLGGTLGLAVLAFLAWRSWRNRAAERTAYEVARDRLNSLLARFGVPGPDQLDAFYVELSGIVRGYLEARFELRAPELTTEEFLLTAGRSTALTSAHQRLLQTFLRQADLVKFARVQPEADAIDQSVAAARQFLEETRELSAPAPVRAPIPARSAVAASAAEGPRPP